MGKSPIQSLIMAYILQVSHYILGLPVPQHVLFCEPSGELGIQVAAWKTCSGELDLLTSGELDPLCELVKQCKHLHAYELFFVFFYIYLIEFPKAHIAIYQFYNHKGFVEQIHIFRFLVCDTPKKILYSKLS